MQNIFRTHRPSIGPLAQSLIAVCGLMVWLRLGSVLSFSFLLSQGAFGMAGVWQLSFSENAPPHVPKRVLPLSEALKYVCLRGIPILITYLVMGYFALKVFVPLLRTSAPWQSAISLFHLERARAPSVIKILCAECVQNAPSLGIHVALTVGAAWIEELFWRGYVQPIWCMACLARHKPERLGIFLQALAFGAAHVAADLNLSRMATALPGLWFGHAALRTGGLWAPTALHVGCNLAAGLLHFGVTTPLF